MHIYIYVSFVWYIQIIKKNVCIYVCKHKHMNSGRRDEGRYMIHVRACCLQAVSLVAEVATSTICRYNTRYSEYPQYTH